MQSERVVHRTGLLSIGAALDRTIDSQDRDPEDRRHSDWAVGAAQGHLFFQVARRTADREEDP